MVQKILLKQIISNRIPILKLWLNQMYPGWWWTSHILQIDYPPWNNHDTKCQAERSYTEPGLDGLIDGLIMSYCSLISPKINEQKARFNDMQQ